MAFANSGTRDVAPGRLYVRRLSTLCAPSLYNSERMTNGTWYRDLYVNDKHAFTTTLKEYQL